MYKVVLAVGARRRSMVVDSTLASARMETRLGQREVRVQFSRSVTCALQPLVVSSRYRTYETLEDRGGQTRARDHPPR